MRRYELLKDDPRFGLNKGDILVGETYWLDPDKVTIHYRESDGFDPECNQYRDDVRFISERNGT